MQRPENPKSPTLRTNFSQSSTELRQFVASLKGKTPAEAMGAVAHSRLARGMVLSAVIQIGAVALLTVPYALWPRQTTKAVSPTPAVADSPASPVAAPATEPAPAPAAQPEPTPAQPPSAPKNADGTPLRMDDIGDLIDKAH